MRDEIMQNRYSEEIKDSIIKKMMAPNPVTVSELVKETGVSDVTLYKWRKAYRNKGNAVVENAINAEKWTSANKLSGKERQAILEVCNSPEFSSRSPKQIVPALADRGGYLCSESSFYRILRDEGLSRHRGRAASPAAKKKPKAYVAQMRLIKYGLGTSPIWRAQ